MRGNNKKIQREIKRYLAVLLVLTMLPLSSFPAKAVQVEEIQTEQPASESTQTQTLQQPEAVSDDSISQVTEPAEPEDTKKPEVTLETDKKAEPAETTETDRASAYLDPAIREQSLGDMTVTETWVLEEDTVVDELVFSGEKIELNGYTLTVCEDFVFEKGYLYSYNSDLIVWGDFRIQSRTWDETQGIYTYGTSEAYMSVYGTTSDPNYVLVAGDMYVASSDLKTSGLSGIWEFKGNLYQKENESAKTSESYVFANDGLNFDYSSQILLSGDEKQILQWSGANTSNQIGNLIIANTSEDGVVFEREPLVYTSIDMSKGMKTSGVLRVYDTIDFIQQYFCGDLKVCDYRYASIEIPLELDGNLYLQGQLDLRSDTTIHGDVIVLDTKESTSYGAYLYACNINFTVDGNINAAEAKRNWTFYVNNYTGEEKEFILGGDFVGENVNFQTEDMTIKFYRNISVAQKTETSTYVYFDVNTSHVILCGNQRQDIDLGGNTEKFWFGTVESQNESEEGVHFSDLTWVTNLILNGNSVYFDEIAAVVGQTLQEDIVFEEDTLFVNGTWDLNGHQMICKGDLRVYEGTVCINGGALSVSGNCMVDYHGMIDMTNAKDIMTVDGDMTFMSRYTTEGHLTNGLLLVHGNFSAVPEHGYDKGFYTTDQHVTRIVRKNYSEEKVHTILLENEQDEPYFATLEIATNVDKYYAYDGNLADTAKKLSTYYYDEERPTSVGYIYTKETTYTSVTLGFEQAQDSDGIAYYEIYRDGEVIETIPADSTSYCDLRLDENNTYCYEIFAYDTTGFKSLTSPKHYVSTLKDITPPSKVQVLSVNERTGSRIALDWDASTDDYRMGSYILYRNGEILAEGIAATYYNDTEVEPGVTYEYYVVAVDKVGNKSENSRKLEVAAVLPEIVSIYPEDASAIGSTPFKGSITLVNDTLAGTRKVTLSYYDEETGEWCIVYEGSIIRDSIIKKNVCHSIQTDIPKLSNDENVRFKWTVKDIDDNSVEQEMIYHVDKTAPAPATNLEAVQDDAKVTLTWTGSEDEDCSKYHIYRKTVSENTLTDPYEFIATVNATSENTYSYIDKEVSQQYAYSYMVKATDPFDNESESEQADVYVELDLIPPTPPTEVYVRSRTGSTITISCVGATDNVGVEGYNIYRDDKLIAENVKSYIYKDTGSDLEDGLKEYVVYNYSVEALDLAGNVSEKSQEVEGAVFMPEITEILPKDQDTIGGETVKITVKFKDSGNSEGNLTFIEWYDEKQGLWTNLHENGIKQLGSRNGNISAYYTMQISKLGVEETKQIDFRITVLDADGNETEEIVTYTIDKTPAVSPTDVSVEENNETVVITWEPSDSTDTQGYYLYRASDGEDFRLHAEITGRMSGWYQDKEVETGKTYTYCLSAYDAFDQEGAKSEEAKITIISADESEPQIKSMEPGAGRVNKEISIKVEGYDNREVVAADFYIRTEEESEWRSLSTVSANDSVVKYNWDTTSVTDGTYYIKAEVRDAAGNVNKNLYQRRYEVDNTGISKIEFAQCQSLASAIRLKWKDVTEEDFDYFAVEQQVEKTKDEETYFEWECIQKIKDSLGCDVKNLQPGTTYTFRVAGYDDLGNRGEVSDEIMITTLVDESAPVIKRIDPAISYYGDTMTLKITAEDNVCIDKAVFSYSEDGEEYEILAEVSSDGKAKDTLSYEWDISALREGDVHVRFEVYDTTGLHNRLLEGEKQIECVYTIDHTAPDKVKNVWTTDTDGCVGLSWQLGEETDIEKYCIYRSLQSDGEYTQIACKPLQNYYDNSVEYGLTYYYKVSCIDIAGNESELSEPLKVDVSPDKIQPVITGIAPADAEVLGKETVFSVFAYDNAKIAQVRMEYRLKSGGTWIQIGEKESGKREAYIKIDWTASDLQEGEIYEIRAIALDGAGNASLPCVKEYSFDITPPETPVLSAEVGSYRICLQYTGTEDAQEYEIWRRKLGENDYKRILTTTAHAYEDVTVEPNTIYYYKVRAYDAYGNYSESEAVYSHASSVDTIAPVAQLPEVLMAVNGVNTAFDGTMSTDNKRIIRYEWNFGDGTKATGAKPQHNYSASGTYTVTLTTYDRAGNSHTTYSTVDVRDYTTYGQTNVYVKGSDGLPVAGAQIYVNVDGTEEATIRCKTDSNGMATLVAESGIYEVAAFAEGYTPASHFVEINQGETKKEEILLSANDFVTGEIKVERMELADLIAAGVDMSDPENYHTFKFQVTLGFVEAPIPVVVVGNCTGAAKKSAKSYGFRNYSFNNNGGDFEIICQEDEEDEAPEPVALIYMSVTKSVSWLKDMYNVQLSITNHASGGFVLTDSAATLDIPKGLSLAKTKSGQTMTEQMGDIDGQETACVNWIVRGDESGSYPIKANFSANLMPFDVPINRQFESVGDVHVPAGKGLIVTVMPEKTAFFGEEYYIHFGIKNSSSRTLYNVEMKLESTDQSWAEEEIAPLAISIADPETCEIREENIDGVVTYILPGGDGDTRTATVRPGDSIQIGMLGPGESISSKFVGSLPVSDEDHYLRLVEAFATILEGANTGAIVEIRPVDSHIRMPVKYVMEEESTTYGDPVDVTSGAFLQSFSAFMGGDTSFIDLMYDSTKIVSGNDLGYGWSHSYDQRIYQRDGELYLSLGTGAEIPFISEIDSENATRGVIQSTGDGEYSLFVAEQTKCEGKGNENLVPGGPAKALFGGMLLKKRTKDTTEYTLTDAQGTEWFFDKDGYLTKRITKAGITFTYVRTENVQIITNETTKEQLILTYEDGKIIEICDHTDRKITLGYDEKGDLTTYTDEEGNTTQLGYDENHHLQKGIGPTGILLFENTYDDKGRVTSQIEAGSSKKSLFAYEELANSALKTTITKRDGNQLTYVSDKNGNITYDIDELGNVTTYEYNEKGALIREVSPNGNTITYAYNEDGNLTELTDAQGNTLKYTYDSNGNPATITGADGSQATYVYDENDRLLSSSGILGEERTYEYDDLGLLKKETITGLGSISYTYENGKKISETDRLGNKTTYSYDAYGHLISSTDAAGNTSKARYDTMGRVIDAKDAAGLATHYQYDTLGRLVKEIVGDKETGYTYDDAGRVTSVTDPIGACTTYAYDTEGNVTTVIHPDGNKTIHTYDAAGRLTETTLPDKSKQQYEYDADGHLIAETVAGQKTSYTYYAGGKKKTTSYPDGRKESYNYDLNGYLTSVTDKDGNITKYTYDAAGHLLSATDALMNTQRYDYDIHGNCVKQTDKNGNAETYTYDANGNCTSKTNAEGITYHMAYDALNRLESVSVEVEGQILTNSYTYDEAGRITSMTDAEGGIQTVTYDIYGNVTKITGEDGNALQKLSYDLRGFVNTAETAGGDMTKYVYDIGGNLSQMTDENGKVYSYAYDAMGRMTESTDPLQGVTAATYTKFGEINTITDPLGGVTTYRYDEFNRVASVTNAINAMQKYTYNAQGLLATAENARSQQTKYTYDVLGRIVSQTDELGTISYTYDANGNVVKVEEKQGLFTKEITRTFDSMNRVTSVTDYNGKTIKYGYDQLGNRISITYPGGEIVRYTYDKCGRMLSATDAKGNVTRFTYSKAGKLLTQTRPDGSVESRTYDAEGQLIKQEDAAADGSILHTITYAYDSAGNVIEKTGEKNSGKETLTNITMTYDADNRLITYNGEEITYDADGNMLHGPLDGQMADFTYDCRNRLIKVETEDGETTEYAYDAENIRLSATTDDERRTFVTDRETTYSQMLTEEIEEQNLFGIFTDKEVKIYTYGNGLLSEYRESEDKTLYYHFNNIGSTLKVTGEDGEIRHEFSYGTYGELLSYDEDADIRFLFNGEYGIQTDKNSLYYMRARYYNTDIKRFINRDVVEGSIENSQSLNKYSYVQGNPVSLTDPFGLCPEGAFNGFDGHDLLDLIGLFFDGADLVNALWYLAEGDVKNALMSAGALLPVVGLLGIGGYKLAKNGIKLGKKLPDAAKYTNKFTKFANDAKNALNKFGNKFNKVKDNVKNAFKKSGDIGKGAKQAAKADKAIDTAKAAAKASAKNADEAASAVKGGSKSGSNTSWYKADGTINYPPNNGAVPGTEVNITLKSGDTLGRYGNIGDKSNFVTQTGADASKLALPPNTDPAIYQEFKVVKEIPGAIQAEIAPWGGSTGGGLQYELPMPILQLIREGYIVPR